MWQGSPGSAQTSQWRGRVRTLLQGPLGPLLIAAGLLLTVVLPQRFDQEPPVEVAAGARLACSLVQVIDGDTIDVRCEAGSLRVRLWGIDAPESGQQPWGDAAGRRLRELLGNDTINLGVQGLDVYDRVLARVSLPGVDDAGLRLVREGFASVRTQYVTDQAYRAARQNARNQRLGIWSVPGAQQRPWEWRKLNPRQTRPAKMP